MVIGERLRVLREGKNLSQDDVENLTGLKRCYISRVENGHTIPALETLEKMAHAWEVPLYRLFYEGSEQPEVLQFPNQGNDSLWGSSGKEAAYLTRLCRCLAHMSGRNRNLLMSTLQKMTKSKSAAKRSKAARSMPGLKSGRETSPTTELSGAEAVELDVAESLLRS